MGPCGLRAFLWLLVAAGLFVELWTVSSKIEMANIKFLSKNIDQDVFIIVFVWLLSNFLIDNSGCMLLNLTAHLV